MIRIGVSICINTYNKSDSIITIIIIIIPDCCLSTFLTPYLSVYLSMYLPTDTILLIPSLS